MAILSYKKRVQIPSTPPVDLEVDYDFGTGETILDRFMRRGNQKLNFKEMYPINGGVSLSDSCNLSCDYCAFSSGEHKTMIASFVNVKCFIDDLLKNYITGRLVNNNNDTMHIYFAGGGEPTYNFSLLKKTVEYIKHVTENKSIPTQLSITTNGFFNLNVAEFISRNFDYITVSFDGTPSVQNEHRPTSNGSGSFQLINKNLEFFKDKDIGIMMKSTLWPDDYSKLFEMHQFITSNYPNVYYWSVDPINPRGRAKESNENITERFYNFFVSAKKSIKISGEKDIMHTGKFMNNVVSFMCGTAFGVNPWLLADGKVISCIDGADKSSLLGKIEDGLYTKYTYSENLVRILLQNRDDCNDCFAFNFCGSGCPIRYTSKHEYNQRNLECNIIRRYWLNMFNDLIEKGLVDGWSLESIDIGLNDETKAYRIWREEWN